MEHSTIASNGNGADGMVRIAYIALVKHLLQLPIKSRQTAMMGTTFTLGIGLETVAILRASVQMHGGMRLEYFALEDGEPSDPVIVWAETTQSTGRRFVEDVIGTISSAVPSNTHKAVAQEIADALSAGLENPGDDDTCNAKPISETMQDQAAKLRRPRG